MSDRSRIVAAIRPLGIPLTAYAWPEEDGVAKTPPVPYVVFYELGETVLYADDTRYSALVTYSLELWEKAPDNGLHTRLEDALAGAFGPFSRDTHRDAKEQCVVTTYEFTVTPERG